MIARAYGDNRFWETGFGKQAHLDTVSETYLCSDGSLAAASLFVFFLQLEKRGACVCAVRFSNFSFVIVFVSRVIYSWNTIPVRATLHVATRRRFWT